VRFPFKVADEKQAVRFAKEFEHVIIDTQPRKSQSHAAAVSQTVSEIASARAEK